VGVKAVAVFLRANLQGMVVAVEFEVRFLLETSLRGGDLGFDFSLKGGGVRGSDAGSIEGSFDFVLHFTTAREEALFQDLLCVEVDGVF